MRYLDEIEASGTSGLFDAVTGQSPYQTLDQSVDIDPQIHEIQIQSGEVLSQPNEIDTHPDQIYFQSDQVSPLLNEVSTLSDESTLDEDSKQPQQGLGSFMSEIPQGGLDLRQIVNHGNVNEQHHIYQLGNGNNNMQGNIQQIQMKQRKKNKKKNKKNKKVRNFA